MGVKGFKLSDGTVQKYEYSALENIVTDSTLSVDGVAADAGAVGDELSVLKTKSFDLDELDRLKLTGLDGSNIEVEQLLSDFNRYEGIFTSNVDESIENWLDEHPEATTTVQDGSLTSDKFSDALKLVTIKDYVTPQMYDAKGDGVTDDTTAVQNALNSGHVVLFPEGIYLVTSPLTIHNSICGIVSPRMGGNGSVIKCGFNSNTEYVINFTDGNDGVGICIESIAIDCNSKSSGIKYAPQAGARPPIKINNVSIWNHAYIGINIEPASRISRCAMMSNISITAGIENTTACLHLSSYAGDCTLTDFIFMYCKMGILTYGAGLRLENGHIYCGRSNLSDIDAYYNGTVGVNSYANTIATNIYVDSMVQGWVQRYGVANIGTMFVWYDNAFDSAENKNATVIRALDENNAWVDVSTLTVGGELDRVGNLFTNNVKVGSYYIQSLTELPDGTNNKYGLVPVMLPNIGRNKYTLSKFYTKDSSNWRVIGAFYLGGPGVAVIRVSRNQQAVDVVVNYDGSNSLSITGKLVYGLPGTYMFYSRVGAYIYLWAVPYGLLSIESLLSTSGQNIDKSLCGVDISTLPDFVDITQENTDGLTQIISS